MTLFKLSLRNAKRQARDYLVCFVTMVLAAALLYTFNGLVFSEEIQNLSRLMKNMKSIIVLVSIVVICIIGWLVSYTTNFMLSRRSRELGTYILIGLENRQVARMFFLENVAVGGIALSFGFLLGSFVFQILRAIVLTMFDVSYQFSISFSYRAIVLTAIYFVGIYLLAQFKNRRRIRSMKIYDLIYFERKNENAMIQKNGLQKKIFVISIVLGMIGTLCLMMRDLLLGIIGALCIIIFLYGFFASFSSGVPVWFEKHAAQKYQKQNLLIFRTLSAKLSTMGVVMATIALLFTATLVSEGTGMVFRAIFVNRAEQVTCFDLMLGFREQSEKAIKDFMEAIEDSISVKSSRRYSIYLGENTDISDRIEEKMQNVSTYYNEKDVLMRMSDYAALRKMLGYTEVKLEPDTYLIHCRPYVAEALGNWNQTIAAGRHTLRFAGMHTEIFAQNLWNVNGHGFVVVVPDEVVQDRPVSHHIYALMSENPISEAQYTLLENRFDQIINTTWDFDTRLIIRSAEEAETASMTVMTVFPLYYLALTLTMTSAVILTIQQLCETERFQRQFALLYKLGMEHREMRKALRTQLAIYYAMPAIPSIVIGVSFIINLGYSVEPGTMEGVSHPLVITGIALGLFFLIYSLYISMAYHTLKRNVIGKIL